MRCDFCPTEFVQGARYCHMCGKPVGHNNSRIEFRMGRNTGYPKVALTDEQLIFTDSSGRAGIISLGAITGIDIERRWPLLPQILRYSQW